jgi:hypothetical protein
MLPAYFSRTTVFKLIVTPSNNAGGFYFPLMARIIKKKKGYNTYLCYARFEGYNLQVVLRADLVSDSGDTVVILTIEQTPINGDRSTPVIFTAKDVRHLQVGLPVEKVVGFRRLRYLAEQLIQADFELRYQNQYQERIKSKPVAKPKKPRIRK